MLELAPIVFAQQVAETLGGGPQPDLLEARQMQALSLAVHIPIVCFGIAFPAMILYVEGLYLRTGDATYKAVAKRWSKVALIFFAVGVVTGRSRRRSGRSFLRGLGCNWLVCLAVWMALAAEDITGKVLVIFFPIMAFVAMGFDHVVANMFFIPAAIFAGAPDITWWDALHNWPFAFVGNLVGALLFVAGAYWYLYAREVHEEPGDTPSGAREQGDDDQPHAGAREVVAPR